jgi:hypothetical protein
MAPEKEAPEYWRRRAIAVRALAYGEPPHIAATLCAIADAYDDLAERAEERRRARSLSVVREAKAPGEAGE